MMNGRLPVFGQDVPRTRAVAPVSVALVNMPFAVADRPSIQCGLLKAVLTREGHHVDVHYFNLELAAVLGAERYHTIANLRTDQFLGEWLFSTAAFGISGDAGEYRAACPSLGETLEKLGCDFATLCRWRDQELPALIEHWIDGVDWSGYAAVGFTSTFEQNTASFALARALKRRHPGLVTIFGGANFDGGMGYEFLRALPFIDYVVSGEGDRVLPRLVAAIAAGASGVGLGGVSGRSGLEAVDGGSAPPEHDMDGLPDPDYDDYFAALFRIGRERVLGSSPPLLLFESARGCWWGEKHHCTFCGLNAGGMAFRSKSVGRVRAELQRLSARYKIINFEAVDNIMDVGYLDELCQPLGDERFDYQIFYEVKSNLTPAQLRTMARAGIRTIQPGIESLSSHILGLMRKGVTMLKNVRLLKWAHYHGIRVGWNILTGFPGERADDYELQTRLVPLLHHLPPPSGCGPVWLERFSPYFFDGAFPVKKRRPRAAYSWIYPDSLDLEKVAYFWDHEMGDTLPAEAYEPLTGAVEGWKARWQRAAPPVLVYQRAPDWIQVIDRRDDEVRVHAWSGLDAAVYEQCSESERSVEHLATRLGAEAPAIAAALERFCELGLALEENGRYLALAMPVNANW